MASAPDPSTHKRLGRVVLSFDSVAWDRYKKNALLTDIYAKFTQDLAMKLHRLSTGNERFAKASPLYPL